MIRLLIQILLVLMIPFQSRADEPGQRVLGTAVAVEGADFLPWLWRTQFKPVILQAAEPSNLSILAGGGVASAAAFQYEDDVFERNLRGERLMSDQAATTLGRVGSGPLGIGIAALQFCFDRANGLKHSRAIALTSISHLGLAFMVGKSRPGGRGDYLPFRSSFPSGHASSAFATATSLAYAYGYGAGVPAFLVASAIAGARVSENAHWLSDVVAGAALGIYWARASYGADADGGITITPIPVEGGGILTIRAEIN